MMKLLRRNAESVQKQIMSENGLDISRLVNVSQNKLSLPLLFVKCKPNSDIRISQDDSKKHLKLESNQKFSLTDEYHLFQCMDLTSTSERELATMLPPMVLDYLRSLRVVNAKPASQVHSLEHTPMTKLLPSTKEQRYARDKYSQEGHTQTDNA
jgi:hypothetical protein